MESLIDVREPTPYVLRDYQAEAVKNSFRLWDEGVLGTLCRAATGTGKTLIASDAIMKWLNRGDDYRAMVLSFEVQLVHQFAEEVRQWTGISPPIEQGEHTISGRNIPPIVVVSRQSLLCQPLATTEQADFLKLHGIEDVGLLTRSKAKRCINAIRRGSDVDAVRDAIRAANESRYCNHEAGKVSRLYKFDCRRFNWLLIPDEAHRHAYHLQSITHIKDWFDLNPLNRWLGITATPKRGDNVSLGSKMFPGVSLDFPLFSAKGRSAVGEGWAVPYRQVYISVDGVDFASIKQNKGDFDDDALGEALDTEEMLAKLCEPVLEEAGERRTLIFSPTVEMAKHVAAYLNARVRCQCPCGIFQWQPRALLGDGATCRGCKRLLADEHVVIGDRVAESLDGSIPHSQRRKVYEGYQSGEFQFLSVCNLCREGFNNREIGCVAIFRPCSKKASSIAEQMKGRGARPLPNVVDGLATAEERKAAIAASQKPDCLILDLIGTSGLPNCSTTLEIYAEGLDDEVKDLAQRLLQDAEGGMDVAGAIVMAEEQIKAKREHAQQMRDERIARQRAEAERRSRLNAQVRYSKTVVDDQLGGLRQKPIYRGGKRMASDAQLRLLYVLGFQDVDRYSRPPISVAGRMIEQLKSGQRIDEVKRTNRLSLATAEYQARIEACRDGTELDAVWPDLRTDRDRLRREDYDQIIDFARWKRSNL